MSDSASHPDHGEFVVDEQLAQDFAQRGVGNFHPGDRLRFEVIEGEIADTPPADAPFVPLGQRPDWPPSWVGSIKTGETDLSLRAHMAAEEAILAEHENQS
jgi:hypothetical protein